MYCKKCGKKAPEGARTCSCGAPLAMEEYCSGFWDLIGEKPGVHSGEPLQPPSPPPKPPKPPKRGLHGAVLLLPVAVLAVSLLLWWRVDGAVQSLAGKVDGLSSELQMISDRLDAPEDGGTGEDGNDVTGEQETDALGESGPSAEAEDGVFATVTRNDVFCYFPSGNEPEDTFVADFQTEFNATFSEGMSSFDFGGVSYQVVSEGRDLYAIYTTDEAEAPALLGIVCKDKVYLPEGGEELPFEVRYAALRAWANGEDTFTVAVADETGAETDEPGPVTDVAVPVTDDPGPAADETVPETAGTIPAPDGAGPEADGTIPASDGAGMAADETGAGYALDEDGNILQGGDVVGYISRYTVLDANGEPLPRDWAVQAVAAIEAGDGTFTFTGEDGVTDTYTIIPGEDGLSWSVAEAAPEAPEA